MLNRSTVIGVTLDNFDVSYLEDVRAWLPKNGVFDLNIAEEGMTVTLNAANYCQEQHLKINLWVEVKKGRKDKAWAEAVLTKATE